jgi:capsular polysaccharide biosynthesis protein
MGTPLEITPRPLFDIALAGTAEARRAAGLTDVERLGVAGVYERRLPVYADIEAIEPSLAGRWRQLHHAAQQHYPALALTRCAGALVTGQGALVLQDGTLVRESANEFLNRGLVPHGLEQAGENRFHLSRAPRTFVGEAALLVKFPWWRNFGHWLLDGAAVLALLAPRIQKERWALVVGASESPALRRVMLETVLAICPQACLLEQRDAETWSFSELMYLSPPHRTPSMVCPPTLDVLRSAVIPKETETGRRIYLSRGGADARRLVNEAELMPVLQKFDIELVYPERLSLPAQARLFSAADVVVGAKGAALANLVFSRPGSAVVVLSPGDFEDPFFWDIAGQKQMAYAEVFGPVLSTNSASRNDFSIRPDQLEAALQAVLT